MNTSFNVDGMMCPKCEARVKNALEAISGVESAIADRTTGTATVTGENLDLVALKAAVKEAGYQPEE
ncbi:MAG: heavy-metal-associated domain-containing protein [Oscillospiraceae bacterium]|nr:heavy-metal-associated domain-containing protein [Oscillospiraceae bacterium]